MVGFLPQCCPCILARNCFTSCYHLGPISEFLSQSHHRAQPRIICWINTVLLVLSYGPAEISRSFSLSTCPLKYNLASHIVYTERQIATEDFTSPQFYIIGCWNITPLLIRCEYFRLVTLVYLAHMQAASNEHLATRHACARI